MKKKNLFSVLLIGLCAAAWLGYQALDRMQTDTVSPVITVDPQPLELKVADPREMMLAGISAADKQDGDVTGSLIVEQVRLVDPAEGKAIATVAAFDRSGNVSKAERELWYSDYVSPRFALSDDLVFIQNTVFDPLDSVTVSDMIDGDITYRIRATAMDGTPLGAEGEHQLQFQVTNSLADTVNMVLPVEVIAPGMYNAEVTLTDYLVYLKTGDDFDETDYLDQFNAGAVTASLRGGMPEQFTLRTSSSVNTNVPGLYTVSYTVTRVPGGGYYQTFAGYTKLIVVVEG